VTIYALRGQAVRTLVNASQAAGEKAVAWDGRDNQGAMAASGVYWYRLTSRVTEDVAAALSGWDAMENGAFMAVHQHEN